MPCLAGQLHEPAAVLGRHPLLTGRLLDCLAGRQMDCQADQCAVVAHADRARPELLPVVVDVRDVLQFEA